MAVARRHPGPRIVYIGADVRRLFARVQALRSAGYEVIATTNRHVAVLAACEDGIDGIVVCDSFSTADDEALMFDLAVVAPRTAVLRARELAPQGASFEKHLVRTVDRMFRGTDPR